MQITPRLTFIHLLEKDRPQAVAWIKGNEDNSRLGGLVKFFSTLYGGVLIEAEILGCRIFRRRTLRIFMLCIFTRRETVRKILQRREDIIIREECPILCMQEI